MGGRRAEHEPGDPQDGLDAVTHGFRSSFRDYAAEQTHMPVAILRASRGIDRPAGEADLRNVRIPAIVIARSEVNAIGDSGQSAHQSERSYAGAGL